QCGAPATLEETDHLFSCEFCRVKSYLLGRFYQYVLPQSAPKNKELFYYPYWRFKGMLFNCTANGITHRILDVSHQAIPSDRFPVSVGLRSQTLKLRFLAPDMEGYFLKPSVPFQEVVQIVEKRFASMEQNSMFGQSFIGESTSLLYSPFYSDTKIYDAVLNKPLLSENPGDFNAFSLPGGTPDWNIKFIPAQCPECGWDLDGARNSLALQCNNCKTVWQAGKKQFMKLKFGYIPDEGKNVTYLPFWRIKADVTGINLGSYADLVKIANLPKVIQSQWEEQAFRFWSPAFKVRPQNFMSLSRNLTLSQPQDRIESALPDRTVHPVTLSIWEAIEGLKMNLASFMKPPKILYPKLPEINIKPQSFVLVYIPFYERGTELNQPAYRLRINKNILKFARYL
ncbi:MAG: hypothetical protein JRJ85_12505, partial [Deltaproteobacteria bacterium]|nr:hypothetical protein [Deltaproteobacteria bacterium]